MRPSDHPFHIDPAGDHPAADPATRRASTTIVLVDPTAPDGETSLDELHGDDRYVLIVTLLTGRASFALREYAHHEGCSITEAGWIYLDQVAERVARPSRTVGTIAATGPDTAQELASIAVEHDVDRVVFPSSIARYDRTAPRRLAQAVPVEIVAPSLTARITVAG